MAHWISELPRQQLERNRDISNRLFNAASMRRLLSIVEHRQNRSYSR